MNEPLSVEYLYSAYRQRIVNYLVRFAGRDAAEDIAQDVFLKAAAALPSFRGESSAYTWLYRIATNCAIDRVRRADSRELAAKNVCSIADAALYRSDSGYRTDEFNVIQREMGECICSYVKQLPPRYRAVVLMSEFENLALTEIAGVMNLSVNTAKTLLYRAKRKLREILSVSCAFYYNELGEFSCEKK